METFHQVLTAGWLDLAGAVGARAGMHQSVALRFVGIAGAELIGSYRWQQADLDLEDLSAPKNVRALMGGLNAARIARELGVPLPIVWEGLRAFVPSVVQQVGRELAARSDTRPRPARSHVRPGPGPVHQRRAAPLYPRA